MAAAIRDALERMMPGDSFFYDHADNKEFYRVAKLLKVKIVARKLYEGGFRVWRVK